MALLWASGPAVLFDEPIGTMTDQEHERFANEFQVTLRALAKFVETSNQQVPFLLRKAPRAFPTPGGEEPPTAPSHLGFHTKVMDPTKPAPPPQRLPGVLVMPLTKAEGGAFAERISVGRALNCDVVIRDESVSKLHAYFRIVTATTAEVTCRPVAFW